MLTLTTFTSAVLGANCYVVESDAGACVVIDPAGGVFGVVRDHVESRQLRVVGVLATHGHVDHTLDAAQFVDAFDVPLTVAEGDAYRIADPFGTLEPTGGGLVAAIAGATGLDVAAHVVPKRVESWKGTSTPLGFDGVAITALAAPGHTEGSTLYRADDVVVDGQPCRIVFSGDVLFAGTIGRTDLPGADPSAMQHTLAEVVCALGNDVIVFPGHGPLTTIGRERVTNPYLSFASGR